MQKYMYASYIHPWRNNPRRSGPPPLSCAAATQHRTFKRCHVSPASRTRIQRYKNVIIQFGNALTTPERILYIQLEMLWG